MLDDYHLVGNPEIDEGLSSFLEHVPQTLELVVSSRSEPALPLARLRARGELAEIDVQQLRFSEEEAGFFFNDLHGLGLDTEDVIRLRELTEGWAAGLYLATLTIRGRASAHEFIEAFAGDNRHVVDYLSAEVLAGLPEEMRGFLLHTSPLERLCGPLCDAVTDRPGSCSSCTSSSARTSSSSLSMRNASGTGTTTSSASSSATSSRSSSPSRCARCIAGRAHGTESRAIRPRRSITPPRQGTSPMPRS